MIWFQRIIDWFNAFGSIRIDNTEDPTIGPKLIHRRR